MYTRTIPHVLNEGWTPVHVEMLTNPKNDIRMRTPDVLIQYSVSRRLKNGMKVKIRAFLHYTHECLTITNGMKPGKGKMEEYKETFQDKA